MEAVRKREENKHEKRVMDSRLANYRERRAKEWLKERSRGEKGMESEKDGLFGERDEAWRWKKSEKGCKRLWQIDRRSKKSYRGKTKNKRRAKARGKRGRAMRMAREGMLGSTLFRTTANCMWR